MSDLLLLLMTFIVINVPSLYIITEVGCCFMYTGCGRCADTLKIALIVRSLNVSVSASCQGQAGLLQFFFAGSIPVQDGVAVSADFKND